MAEVDLTMAFNLTPSLLEQLGKALTELQSHSDATSDTVTFTEISDHFRDLEQKMLQKYTDLESKQHSFNQQQSNHHQSLAEKLAAVTQKEQDMFDRIQLLKDASVAAISEACAAHLPPPVYTTADDVIDDMEVVPNSPGDDVDGGDESVTFYSELTRLCDEMDAKGLVSFFMENRKNVNVLREELSHVLKSSKEPGRLVLDSLQGFYPNTDTVTDTVIDTADSQAMRQSCIYIMEALNVMLEGGEMGADVLLGLEIKQQAKIMADEWKPKLVVHVHDHDHENVNVNDGKSLEAEAFLQLVGTFRIASEFDEDELCKLIFAVCERRHAPNLCRPLGLNHKMPGVVEELISSGKLISAVHFVHGFKLSDRFPTVPLLKTYLKDLRRSSQGKRGNWGNPDSGLNEGNTKELVALQNVVYCVQKYDLETEYPLEAIYRRVEQLERAKVDRKRSRDPPSNNNNRFRDSPTTHHYQNKKRPRGGGRSGDRGGGGGGYGHHHHHRRHGAASNGRHVPAYMDRSLYAAQPGEQYPQVDHYSYPPAQAAAPLGTQAAYSQQVYEQSAYYYPPPDPAAATPAAATYGVTYTSSGAPAAYQPTPYQPYYQ